MPVYLVTGVAGFIGSNIALELVRRGAEVRGFDNFETGKQENLVDLKEKILFREFSLLDSPALQEFCHGVDYIFHEAAIPSVPRSVIEPVSSHNANVTGTLNLLMAARNAEVKRIVYAASSSAYGDQPVLPKREDMPPDPISPYAVQKLAGEHYLRSFSRVYGLETVSLRYFNVFGPRQDPSSQYSGVLAKFIANMLTGKQCTIFGDGEQSRDFTYVDNVVNANLLVCSASAGKVSGRTFNVASGNRYSLNQTFSILKSIIGYSGQPQYAETRAGDVRDSLADISQLHAAVGYVPSVGFEEGLQRTVTWYKDNLTRSLANAR